LGSFIGTPIVYAIHTITLRDAQFLSIAVISGTLVSIELLESV